MQLHNFGNGCRSRNEIREHQSHHQLSRGAVRGGKVAQLLRNWRRSSELFAAPSLPTPYGRTPNKNKHVLLGVVLIRFVAESLFMKVVKKL